LVSGDAVLVDDRRLGHVGVVGSLPLGDSLEVFGARRAHVCANGYHF
jgi:hypothetical protein